MKLLFDENLAARLSRDVADLFPNSLHLEDLNLVGAKDLEIWDRAAEGEFVLVTKDQDFHRLSVMKGPPPKVLWIRLGNCSTSDVAALLRASSIRISHFLSDAEAGFLGLGDS